MAPWRKCVFPGCQARQSSSISLFAFPKNAEMKKRWIDFVKRHHYGDGELRITSSTAYLCSQHFTEDSFSNLQRRQLGFTEKRLLVSGAEPTVSLPPTPVPPPASATVVGTTTDGVSSLQCKPSRDISWQAVPQMTISLGTQLYKGDLKLNRETRSVGTQLSKNSLVHHRSAGSQTMVLSVSVCVGTPVQWKRSPSVFSSTRQEPFQSSKRRRLNIPAQSVLTESTLSQASPSINDVPKYVVDEDCLLQLFEECPVCSSMCEVQKSTRETFLTVYQLCPQCHFNRNWRSQQTEKTMPSVDARCCTIDPESSAAANTKIIGFSDENDSSDERQNREVDDHSLGSPGESQYRCSFSQSSQLKSHMHVRPTDRPRGGPKRNDVITSDDANQLKRHLCISDENEEGQGNSHSTDKEQDHNNDSDVNSELADEGQSNEVDSGDNNSDSDWDPLEYIESNTDENNEEGLRQLCPECGRFFHNQSQRTHICWYKKPHSCIVCGKRFICEYKLKVHNKIHEDGYKHVCKYCCSTFRTKHDKLVHEQSHPPAEKPYQCPDCPEVFAKMRERRDHLLSHRGPTKHICHICNMEFRSNSALERHVVVHTKAKQFVCEVCQRSFTQQSHLKSHMRLHTGEKPYQCQHCDKSYNHNVSLKTHIQRYHGQVPDPGEKVQTEKTSRNESETERDELNEMESSAVDAEEADKSKDTLCNAENGGDEEEEKKEDKCTNKYPRPTGRPIGRPKNNAVITLEDADQLKRLVCSSDENEKDQGNSDSTDEEQ